MNRGGTETPRDPLTERITGAAIEVHRHLGPGLLESAYEACLTWELIRARLQIARQVPVPLVYEGLRLDPGYRADIVVGGRVIVELKTVEKLMAIHTAQLLTYLKLTGLRTGLLLNFNALQLKDGVVRVAL